jgi:glycine/D-amino acid oxidase-like deaminating enzyme
MTDQNLPTPDFSYTEPLSCIAGLRPYREGAYRLESETRSGKFIVHNYGHGGAGITLSWGCASKVRDIVRNHLASSNDRTVAVLGSGVMGLTAATFLVDLGVTVTIYAKEFWNDTTSRKAGGQWAASIVEFGNKRTEFKEILETSYRTFKSSIPDGFGVSYQPNYTKTPSHNLDIVLQLSPNLIPARQKLARMPFENHTYPGYKYQTLLIEPSIFLPKLDTNLRARNVQFIPRTFSDATDVLTNVQENIIINCTGLGSKTIWNDAALKPKKGQLALLRPQSQLQYLYGQDGYMFPRADAVVIGGSYEDTFTSADPDPAYCKLLVDYMKGLFGKGPRIPIPDWHIHHPDNLPRIAPKAAPDV